MVCRFRGRSGLAIIGLFSFLCTICSAQPAITEYVIPTPGSYPSGIAAGPDGALWFTEFEGKSGRITTAGIITEYVIPTAGALPSGIAAGRAGPSRPSWSGW